MNKFKEISASEITENPFKLINKDWMLITAGDENKFNTMTASWGGVGILWNKPVAFTFIRPQRYTFEFTEKGEYYTLSFFDDSYREALNFCGTKSGREYDKVKETGLTPVFTEQAPCFEEAKLVLVCRKLYSQFLTEDSLTDKALISNYANNDWHKMYVGEIEKVFIKE